MARGGNRLRSSLVLGAMALVSVIELTSGAQVSVGIESDMSKPTWGMHGPSSSSIKYDDRNGLSLKGAIGDILGPPIKIAQGFGNMISGGNMAGIGNSLQANGAVLGFDAKLLEAAGGANLLKGGLLMTATKGGVANLDDRVNNLPGKKIASIIEMPVKIVALKDLAAGKVLSTVGKTKAAEAAATKAHGAAMVKEGDALKQQGLGQMMQGAGEGLTNIGQAVQQSAGNAATMLKLLPIMFDIPVTHQQQKQRYEQQLQADKTSPVQQQQVEYQPQQVQQEQQQVQQTQQNQQVAQQEQQYQQVAHQQHQGAHQEGRQSYGGGNVVGGSLFGGLGSLMPDLLRNDPFAASITGINPLGSGTSGGNSGQNRLPFSEYFAGLGNSQSPHQYAAVLNATNPLTNFLMNPGSNPFLLPITGGPIGQALTGKDSGSLPSLAAITLSQLAQGMGPFGQLQQFKQPQHQGRSSDIGQGGSHTTSFNLFPGVKFSETIASHQHQPQVKTQQQHVQELDTKTVQQLDTKTVPHQQQLQLQPQQLQYSQQQQQQQLHQQQGVKQ